MVAQEKNQVAYTFISRIPNQSNENTMDDINVTPNESNIYSLLIYISN